MAGTVEPTGASLLVETPRRLFSADYQRSGFSAPNYDVSPSGDRFLMVQAAQRASRPARLHVVLNWIEELRARVPS